jgi:uncharacterized protein YndB with AHSA1/START domain
MRFERSVEIDAPAGRVWDSVVDVQRWPEWTASMSQVTRLDEGALRVGSRARIKQPRFPVLVWTVTQVDQGRSFTWEATGPGARTVAVHTIVALGEGRAKVTLEIEQTGWINSIVGLFATKTTRTYLRLESEGLKRKAESGG